MNKLLILSAIIGIILLLLSPILFLSTGYPGILALMIGSAILIIDLIIGIYKIGKKIFNMIKNPHKSQKSTIIDQDTDKAIELKPVKNNKNLLTTIQKITNLITPTQYWILIIILSLFSIITDFTIRYFTKIVTSGGRDPTGLSTIIIFIPVLIFIIYFLLLLLKNKLYLIFGTVYFFRNIIYGITNLNPTSFFLDILLSILIIFSLIKFYKSQNQSHNLLSKNKINIILIILLIISIIIKIAYFINQLSHVDLTFIIIPTLFVGLITIYLVIKQKKVSIYSASVYYILTIILPSIYLIFQNSTMMLNINNPLSLLITILFSFTTLFAGFFIAIIELIIILLIHKLNFKNKLTLPFNISFKQINTILLGLFVIILIITILSFTTNQISETNNCNNFKNKELIGAWQPETSQCIEFYCNNTGAYSKSCHLKTNIKEATFNFEVKDSNIILSNFYPEHTSKWFPTSRSFEIDGNYLTLNGILYVRANKDYKNQISKKKRDDYWVEENIHQEKLIECDMNYLDSANRGRWLKKYFDKSSTDKEIQDFLEKISNSVCIYQIRLNSQQLDRELPNLKYFENYKNLLTLELSDFKLLSLEGIEKHTSLYKIDISVKEDTNLLPLTSPNLGILQEILFITPSENKCQELKELMPNTKVTCAYNFS
jgi:hypothetical protein